MAEVAQDDRNGLDRSPRAPPGPAAEGCTDVVSPGGDRDYGREARTDYKAKYTANRNSIALIPKCRGAISGPDL